MYIERVPNRNSPPAVLLRESYREHGRVKKRTLANLSHLPDTTIEQLRRVLRGKALVAPEHAFTIQRSRPHGHVAAVLGTLRKLGLERRLATRRSPERDRAVALIASRVLASDSKLATARQLDRDRATSTLGELLGLETVAAEDLYAAMDWLGARRRRGSPVRPAVRSESAEEKAFTKKTSEGETVHRFRGLLDHLATLTKNTIQPEGNLPPFEQLSVPTRLQQKAFDLLGVPIPL